ncbi:MAG TPA: threonine synthase [Candidatus Dormibacteraeota bacterium]|nr:threonine synthase [Candidatus Dormibacteraeota bacterium]
MSTAGRRDPTGSRLAFLEGSRSGARYDSDQLLGTDPADGRTLLARYDLEAARGPLSAGIAAGRRRGLWRWEELLPVRDRRFVTTLGEGATRLLPPGRLARELRLSRLHIKAESLNPTGSFKARGMAVAVSRAAELGARRLVAPSAGNAAGALAAYAAAAGLPATVVMPADAPLANQLETIACGARLILVDGLISDCGQLARLVCEATGGFDMATLREPYRVEGKKTLGFELAEDFGWSLPEAVVYPTGGGTGLIGMWKAFDELEAIGLIGAARPRMYAVQSDGCAPIVRAFEEGSAFAEPWSGAATRAAGIRVPATVGDHLILDCLHRSGGGAVAVPEAEIGEMQSFAARHGAGYLSLETAAALAALPIMLERGLIGRDERVALFDTGAGFKSEGPSLERPPIVPNDPDAWPAVVAALRD